jgi:hypothetical protein
MGGFHTGKHVPAEYTNYWWSARARGTASQKSGYDVVTMVADADGKNATVHHGLSWTTRSKPSVAHAANA